MVAKSHLFSNLRANILSGIVVFIIAVPLSLGIALASGMPPVSALIAAVVGGVIVGFVSGAPIVVSGPAAGLSALVLGYVQQFGVQAVYAIAVMAGLLQIIFGILKLGRFISKIPKPLLEGVLTAIGFTIFLGQLHVLMGQKATPGIVGGLTDLPQSISRAVSISESFNVAPAFICGLMALCIQLLWPKFFKKWRWIPAALPGVFIATVATLSFEAPRVVLDSMGSHIFETFSLFASGDIVASWLPLIVPAIGLAVVASAESLLTARAIDVLVKSRHPHSATNFEQELLAQGLGNMVSGLAGGMPSTGVMVRSAANIESGATTRLSTIIHGLLVALCVAFLPAVLEAIPLSVLASVLVITGWRLLNIPTLIKTFKHRHDDAYLWPLTTIAILGTDLLRGFGFGVAVWLVVLGLNTKFNIKKKTHS